jgi:hypothetical protein
VRNDGRSRKSVPGYFDCDVLVLPLLAETAIVNSFD